VNAWTRSNRPAARSSVGSANPRVAPSPLGADALVVRADLQQHLPIDRRLAGGKSVADRLDMETGPEPVGDVFVVLGFVLDERAAE
jgi:hypothetical protein